MVILVLCGAETSRMFGRLRSGDVRAFVDTATSDVITNSLLQ